MENEDRWKPRREDEEEEEILIPSRSRRQRSRESAGNGERKAPLPLRVVAWLALLALFFGIGYVVAGVGLKWLQSRGFVRQEDVAGSGDEAKRALQDASASSSGKLRRNDYKVYCLGPEGLAEKTKSVIPGVVEDDLRQVLDLAFESLRSESGLNDQILVLHLFRAGETLYVNVNTTFVAALKKLPKDRGMLFMTGLVRSVVEGFPPTVTLQVLVDGKAPAPGSAPIDLATPWALSPTS